MTEPRERGRAKIDFARFRALAPLAIAAHNTAFYVDEINMAMGRVVWGTLPLIGLLQWNWSASEMLALLLIGYWLDVLVDVLTLRMLSARIACEATQRSDTQYVWSVVESLQKGSDEYDPVYIAPYRPLAALVLDIVLCGIASAMMWAALRGTDTPIVLIHSGSAYLLSVLAILALGLLRLALLFSRRNEPAGKRRTGYAAGMRGVALLVLGFAVGLLGEAATPPMIVAIADAGLVLLGAIGLAGLVIVRGETVWLRAYLAKPENA